MLRLPTSDDSRSESLAIESRVAYGRLKSGAASPTCGAVLVSARAIAADIKAAKPIKKRFIVAPRVQVEGPGDA